MHFYVHINKALARWAQFHRAKPLKSYFSNGARYFQLLSRPSWNGEAVHPAYPTRRLLGRHPQRWIKDFRGLKKEFMSDLQTAQVLDEDFFVWRWPLFRKTEIAYFYLRLGRRHIFWRSMTLTQKFKCLKEGTRGSWLILNPPFQINRCLPY